MILAGDLRKGITFVYENNIYIVVDFLHVKPGKGSAFVRTKLKSFKTGRTLEHTFPAGCKIDTCRVERRPYTYLYKDDTGYNFMHAETYEQINIEESMINAPQFLKEGQYVEIIVHADTETPLSCELPPFVEMEVTYTEPGVKGNTATNAMKDATVETGAKVRIPLFIETGEKIKITLDGTLSANRNAQIYFKKYQKQKKTPEYAERVK